MFSKFIFPLIPLTIIVCTGCESSSNRDQLSQSSGHQAFVEGEVIVGVKKSQSYPLGKGFSKTQAITSYRAKDVSMLGNEGRYLHLKLNDGESVPAAIERLKGHEAVDFVQPNFIYKLLAVPDDPHYGLLWGLKNNGQTIGNVNVAQDDVKLTNNPGTAGFDISAESAWDIITDCSSVVIGVLDAGAKLDHEDLINNLWSNPINGAKGYDAVDNDNDPSDVIIGHGTHVASTIGAEGNNAKGSTGVCWKAKIMPVRVCGSAGCPTSSIISGISYAVAYGAKIINMSLGGPGSPLSDLAYFGAVGNAGTVLFIVAAGNDSSNNTTTPLAPCNFSTLLPNVICVGAVDQAFAMATYSNYSSTAVQISAPGTNILGGSPTTEIKTNALTSGGPWTTSDATWAPAGASLVNPSNYNGTSNTYASSSASSIWKTFNFSTATNLILELDDTHFLSSGDYLRVGFDRNSGVNIFANPTTNFVEVFPQITGHGTDSFRRSSDPYTPSKEIDITNICAGQANCTVGFQLSSGLLFNDYGVQLTSVNLTAVTPVTNSYMIINGTSMATPHVTGVAGLVWSYNPSFTVADVKSAVLNGGKPMAALAGKNSTGSILNAMGALAYIAKPATPEISQ